MLGKIFFIIFSCLIAAFGQAAWVPLFGIIAASASYAIFWGAIEGLKLRFWWGALWFAVIQFIQLSWFHTHPYSYIYPLWVVIALLFGLQFGFLTLLVTRERLNSLMACFALAGLWTLLEWSRLFILSGFSWNPVGLHLSTFIYPLQAASLAGVYGLSFWVMLVNLLLLRAYFKKGSYIAWGAAALFPFLFGAGHIAYHEHQKENDPPQEISALLVQTAFPIEEILPFKKPNDMIDFVFGEWKEILTVLGRHKQEKFDLIALPEFVVPYGTYSSIFPYDKTVALFKEIFGGNVSLPKDEWPLVNEIHGKKFATNAYFAQGIADAFDTHVVGGFEDVERNGEGELEYYTAALFFTPGEIGTEKRYAKRVLVPMGEYIPFKFCQKLCQSYGVGGSFTCGTEAKAFETKKGPVGMSICYEETYGGLMRENKGKGAVALVNLTSDVWYPNSRLPLQHLEHSRLRTVEGGYPLLRSCNTGITCGVDSLGRTVKELDGEWTQDALSLKIPLYTYSTFYSFTGDMFIISFSFLMLGLYLLLGKYKIT